MTTFQREPSPGAGSDAGARGGLGETLVPAPPREGPQFPVLDTLRGLGALAVLLTHVAFWSGSYTQYGAWGTLLARMDVGVALFFVLSGFLLARPWIAAPAGGRPATRRYLWRRLIRIAPLYVVTVALALSLIEQNRDTGVGGWVTTMLMLDTFASSSLPAGLSHMWSLAVEVSFYLLLPLLMRALLGPRPLNPDSPHLRRRLVRLLLGLGAMVALSIWWHLDGAARAGVIGTGLPGQWLPGYLGWFACGILLATVSVLHAQDRASRLTRPFVTLAAQPGSCWALAAGLMLVAATPLAGPSLLVTPTGGEATTKSLLYGAVGLLVVLTGVLTPPGRYTRVLSRSWGRRLGLISFGIFCLHLPLLHLIIWATPWELFTAPLPGLLATTILASVVAAELSYRLVEHPAMRLRQVGPGRRREGRTRSQPTTSSAASGTTTR